MELNRLDLAKQWLVNVVRSPLHSDVKKYIFEQVNRPSEAQLERATAPAARNSLQNVVLAGLLQCCPFVRTQHKLSAFGITHKLLHQLTRRKSEGQYGIHIVKHGTYKELVAVGVTVEKIDFTMEAQSGTRRQRRARGRCCLASVVLMLGVHVCAPSVCVRHGNFDCSVAYHRLLDCFSPLCCFVYVQGLRRVDDIFLKWCAEYTERWPWRFILLEGTDTHFNLPENRDRCQDQRKGHEADSEAAGHETTVLFQRMKALGDAPRDDLAACVRKEFQQQLKHAADTGMRSDYVHTWQAEVLSIVLPSGEVSASAFAPPSLLSGPSPAASPDTIAVGKFFVLIVSPPGAGKTHLLNNTIKPQMEAAGLPMVRIDGSSDELVMVSLHSRLEALFTERRPSLLVIDEYHMLCEAHKNQLFAWLKHERRLEWLRVVLIANRMFGQYARVRLPLQLRRHFRSSLLTGLLCTVRFFLTSCSAGQGSRG